MKNKEIFYHGSGVMFDSFDLEHALEGDGKVKFGYGAPRGMNMWARI